jgi:DNA-binding FrmR family transcriptional regulator
MKKTTRATHEPDTEAPRHGLIVPRLNRVEGQIRGIARMVENDKPCRDILTQISAAREALRRAALMLVEDHLRRCVSSPEAAEEMLALLHSLRS